MRKIDEARNILDQLGMPQQQQTDICCYTLLAMLGIKQNSDWSMSSNNWIRIHDIIQFMNGFYKTDYKENSRESVRKQALHHFRNAALIEDNGKATNSPLYRYRVTEEALSLIRHYRSKQRKTMLQQYLENHEKLKDIYSSKKEMEKMPVRINTADLTFSPGAHNSLQKAIIEEFAPRFAPDCECLYVGDTSEKDLVKNIERLTTLGFEITLHDKMPDVVLYREDKDWIYFIEAVTSVGPMSSKRVLEINSMTKNTKSGIIYVTAFPDLNTYKRFASELAWDTEVWIAEMPDHMIHLNGDRFMGPR